MIALFAAGLSPVLIMMFATNTVTRSATIRAERTKLSEFGNEIARQIQGIIEDATNDLRSLASNPIIVDSNTDKETKNQVFKRLRASYDYLREITLYNTAGHVILSDSKHSDLKREESPGFRYALDGKRFVSRPLTDDKLNPNDQTTLFLDLFFPVSKLEEPPHGVVRASVKFDSFWEILDGARIGETGGFLLLDHNGNHLSAPNKEFILEKFDEGIPATYWTTQPSGKFDKNGVTYVYEAMPIDPSPDMSIPGPWTLLCFQTNEELNAILAGTQRHQLIAGLLSIVLAIAIGYVFAKHLSKSLSTIGSMASKVAQGDLSAAFPPQKLAELKAIADSYNFMVAELKQHRSHLESLVQSRTRRLRESQSSLEELTAQLRAAYDSTPEAILVVHESGKVLASNRHIQQFFGLESEELKLEGLKEGGRTWKQLTDCFEKRNAFRELWRKIDDDSDLVGESEWTVNGEAELQISVYTAPVKNSHGTTFARLWMFNDMTEQRRLEYGLQQAQKMEAIGRLSGGVAHDFNNLLTGIIGSLSLSELQREEDPANANQLIGSARRAAERAAGIVKQLLTFSRQNNVILKPHSANQLVQEAEEIMIPGFDKAIEFVTELDHADPYMIADGNQIDQVVMNLCVNARDALPQGGTIRVSTSRVIVDRDSLPQSDKCKPGEYVKISVEDNGTGMPDEIREKIFEPFYTTKEQGKGTGLGLATSYGIVQQHGGWIDCQSEVGVGTTFSVFIPACEKPPEEKAEINPSVQGGCETILVVDDELIVRRVAEGTLRRQGYKVISAQDGKEALEIIANQGDEIGLIMLDLTMPRLSGRDTFRELRSGRFRHIPVVICSGYLVELESFKEEAGSIPDGAIQKPYQVKDLARQVREIIDKSSADHADATQIGD